jgi:anti-anti-sigma regulatory factor
MARRKAKPEPRRVSLGDDLRIGRAREILDLLAAPADGASVEIDASQVARVDAAGLQALVAGVTRLRAAKVALTWHDVPESLESAASTAGLAALLKIA